MVLSGLISTEEASLKKLQLEEEKKKLTDQLLRLNHNGTEWSDLAIKTFDFVKNIKQRFSNGTPEERKTILRVVGSNLTLKDKVLSVEVRTPFKYVQQMASQLQPDKKQVSVRSNQVWVEDGCCPRDLQVHNLALYC